MILQKIETFDEKAQSVDLNDNQARIYVNDLQVISHQTQKMHQSIIGSEHVSLGSSSALVSIGKIEQQHVDNPSFTDFCKKIGKAFSNYFNKIIKFNVADQVWENHHSKFH